MSSRHRHSFAWRASRAIGHAAQSRPLLWRTGPAWVFGTMAGNGELLLAPVVLAATFAVGLLSYTLLDLQRARLRSTRGPRFISTRILYLNALIVAGFWLVVMFTFSTADPGAVGMEQRLPRLLQTATTHDLAGLITQKKIAGIKPVNRPVGETSTWFTVFLHGLVSVIALNCLLFAAIIV